MCGFKASSVGVGDKEGVCQGSLGEGRRVLVPIGSKIGFSGRLFWKKEEWSGRGPGESGLGSEFCGLLRKQN